jgi:VTC domain
MSSVCLNGTGVAMGSPRWPRPTLEPPFEMKFLVTEARAAQVAAWAAEHLEPDPHAGDSRDDGYRVTSLYLDTPALDVYHRRGSFGRAKYRVRRYDSAPWLFLERKCKVKGRVRKRRTRVGDKELALLGPTAPPGGWPGCWFGRRVALRGLAPTCLVSYERVACVGSGPHGPIRLTIDRDFLCRPGTAIGVPELSAGHVLFAGQGVVELKFRVAMPALFKRLLRDLELTPARASKYRAAVAACGLVPVPGRSEGEVGDA